MLFDIIPTFPEISPLFGEKKSPCGNANQPGLGFKEYPYIFLYIYPIYPYIFPLILYIPIIIPINPINPIYPY